MARIGMPSAATSNGQAQHCMWLDLLLGDLRREMSILVDRASITGDVVSESQKRPDDVIEVKPGLWGISVNFNAMFRRLRCWYRRTHAR